MVLLATQIPIEYMGIQIPIMQSMGIQLRTIDSMEELQNQHQVEFFDTITMPQHTVFFDMALTTPFMAPESDIFLEVWELDQLL